MRVDLSALQEIGPVIQTLRRDLAEHPEVGPDVNRTASKVVELLETTSLRVRSRAGFPEQSAMGVIADLRGIDATETVALVADMSAQNVRRERRQGGAAARCSHVAGNDAHTAMLVGLALLLHRADVPRNIRFIWQSGGEMLSDGSQAMIRDGALEGVDEVFAVHLWPGLELGAVGCVPGPIMASLDRFVLRIQGASVVRPWHHRRVDGIRIGASFVEELDRLSQGIEGAGPHCVVTHFLAADHQQTLSRDEVRIEGEVRAFSQSEREDAADRLERVAEECAASNSGAVQLQLRKRGNVTVNDVDASTRARQRLGGAFSSAELRSVQPSAFSTGLSGYLETVPGAVLALGCGGQTPEPANLLLSPTFDFDDRCLEIGVRALAALAVG